MDDFAKLKETFAMEISDIFANLDTMLLDLEKTPSDTELLNSVFRSAHTMKSSWAMFGYHNLEHFTHLLEDLLDQLRSGGIEATGDVIDLLFDSFDAIKEAYEQVEHGGEVRKDEFEKATALINELLPYSENKDSAGVTAQGSKVNTDSGVREEFIKGLEAPLVEIIKKAASSGRRLYQITVCLDKDALMSGMEPLALFRRLRDDGVILTSRVSCGDIPHINDLDPAVLYFDEIVVLYSSTLGQDEVGNIFTHALEFGTIDIHLLTPKELNEFFGIEADPFWTEPVKPQDKDNNDKTSMLSDDLENQGIRIFKNEIEKGLQAVTENITKLIHSPGDKAALEEVFRFFHNIKVDSVLFGLRELTRVAQPADIIVEKALSGKEPITPQTVDMLFRGVDEVKVLLIKHARETLPGYLEAGGTDADSFLLGELLVDMGVMTKVELVKAIGLQKSLRSGTLEMDEDVLEDVLKPAVGKKKKVFVQTALRIDPTRLDNLVDIVGELVIAQSVVTQDNIIKSIGDARLEKNIVQLSKITKDIQDMVMSMRMVPLVQTFKKMSRVVRDVSKKLGKEVNLCLVGEDTKVDKAIIDEIGDPLIHILRNSVDHGIESLEERVSAGKPEKGKVELSAYHQGGNVVIAIKDDGKGLKKEGIVKKAIQTGLIQDASHMTEQQIYSLIFEPGFSTASSVTKISGRGVGLDAVKKSVEKLRGKIEILTEPDQGTTISIKLPLTLAIIEGMLVKVGLDRYIVPTLSIESSFRPNLGDIINIETKGELVQVREHLLPIVRLHELYDIPTDCEKPSEAILIVVESEDRRCCLMVDEIIGHQHIVIKSLGEHFSKLKGVAGCTILSDGQVGLILDVSGMMDITIG